MNFAKYKKFFSYNSDSIFHRIVALILVLFFFDTMILVF